MARAVGQETEITLGLKELELAADETPMSAEPHDPQHAERAKPPPARGRGRLRHRLTVFVVDATTLLFAVALLGYVGGKLANGPRPAIGSSSGATVVVSVVLLLLICLVVLYARALRHGRTPGQRAAKYRRLS